MTPYRQHDRQTLAKVAANLADGPSQNIPGDHASTEYTDVYLPVAKLIGLRVSAAHELRRKTSALLGDTQADIPFIIGLAGSVAVGKSTTARLLQKALAESAAHTNVALIATDGFLYPNAALEARGIAERKGFPESFDTDRLLEFLRRLKAGDKRVEAPVYSHFYYDVMADETTELHCPDIVIVEGINVLQPRSAEAAQNTNTHPYDFLDFSIYLHAQENDIKHWFTDRFIGLCEEAKNTPKSFLHRFAPLNPNELRDVAEMVWTTINGKNLNEHILPTRQRADLVLHKGPDHAITHIDLRHG